MKKIKMILILDPMVPHQLLLWRGKPLLSITQEGFFNKKIRVMVEEVEK